MTNPKNFKLSGHQTFAFRYGWLEKGYAFLQSGKKFSDDDAIVDLGVGKNMVDSIKYWCEMTGITENGILTDFAHSLLGKNGWDPYLEDDASLWLLQWKLVTNQNHFTSGSALFSLLHKPEFSKRDLAEAISGLLDQKGKKPPSDSMILRDIDCYIRVYAGVRRFEKKKNSDESFSCPLEELDLIIPMTDSEMYRFSIGPKATLPKEIIGFALWDYLNKSKTRESMRIQEALYHEFSPGQAFMLDENSLVDAVNNLNADASWGKFFNFTESAGIATIQCTLPDGNDLLTRYYQKGIFHG